MIHTWVPLVTQQSQEPYTATYREHKEVRPWLGANLQCISQHTTESALYPLDRHCEGKSVGISKLERLGWCGALFCVVITNGVLGYLCHQMNLFSKIFFETIIPLVEL